MATFVLADDSKPQRMWIRSALQAAGHTVVGEASDGQEAIEQCRLHRPDVLTLDISMPVMTGAEAARVILDEGTVKRVAIMTLNTQSSIIEPLREIGCIIITKPIPSKDRFVALVAAAL